MHSYAQTNIQLFNQLQATGYADADLIRIREAYDLAMCLFTGCFRQSGKTFIAHLVGTASILVECRAAAATVAAGLLHSAYSHGEFGSGRRGISEAKRRRLRLSVSEEVENLVAEYTKDPWDKQTVSNFVRHLPLAGTVAHQVLLIRLANELEDHLDCAALYSGAAAYRRQVIESYLFQCVEIAEKLGYPTLSVALSEAFDETLSTELPPPFREENLNLAHKNSVHLIGWKSSFLFPPATHGLRLMVRLGQVLRRLYASRPGRLQLPH